MPTDLLTELTHEAADSSRRTARYVRAFAADLGESNGGTDLRHTELVVRSVLAQVVRVGEDVVRHWRSAFESIRFQFRSPSTRLKIEAAVEMFDSWRELADTTDRLLAAVGRLNIAPDGHAVRDLDAVSGAIKKARAEASAFLAGLDRPRPEIDAARLAQGRKEADEGRAMKSDEVIAAVRAARK